MINGAICVVMCANNSVAEAAVYKCIEDGKTVYSQQPCSVNPETVRITSSPKANELTSPKKSWLTQQADERAAREAAEREHAFKEADKRYQAEKVKENLADAARGDNVKVGMDAAMVERAWGKPQRRNNSLDRSGQFEQWVYERDRYTRDYIYLRNGVVVSVDY